MNGMRRGWRGSGVRGRGIRIRARGAALTAAALLLGGAGAAAGQERGAPPEPERSAALRSAAVDSIISRLGLASEQEAETRPILTESVEERAEILRRAREGADEGRRASRRERMDRIRRVREELETSHERTESRLRAVLTEEQVAAYRRLVEEHRAEMRERLRERRRG